MLFKLNVAFQPDFKIFLIQLWADLSSDSVEKHWSCNNRLTENARKTEEIVNISRENDPNIKGIVNIYIKYLGFSGK